MKATDRQQIAAGPLQGNVTLTKDFISPLAWYYKAADGGDPPAADPAGAASLLEGAGWAKGSDGYYAKDGKTLLIDYCSTTRQVRIDTLNLIASQLKAVEIKANVANKPAGDVFAGWNDVPADTACNMIHGNFDVFEFAYVSPIDPLGGYNVYHSSGIPDNPTAQRPEHHPDQHPALDQAYDTVKGTVDPGQDRGRDGHDPGHRHVRSEQLRAPALLPQGRLSRQPEINNFAPNPTTNEGTWNIGDWWLGQ